MVSLRASNNPNTARVILNAMKTIATGYPTQNTILEPANVYVLSRQLTQLPKAIFPALALWAGKERHKRVGFEYEGTLPVTASYLDRWESQSIAIETIWANMDADLQRVISNLQSNESLAQGGVAYTTSISDLEFSDYEAELDDRLVPGITIVKRECTMIVNLLPYDA